MLTGAGGHFCSGADLGGVEDIAFTDALGAPSTGCARRRLVTIAAVDGVALGAGTQLAVSCDLRVATPAARFGVPAAKLGLAVDHETVRRLAQLAGDGTARAMLLAAEVLDGEALHRTGFVQRLGGLDDALAWAAEIARAGAAHDRRPQARPRARRRHRPTTPRSPTPAAAPGRAPTSRRAWPPSATAGRHRHCPNGECDGSRHLPIRGAPG